MRFFSTTATDGWKVMRVLFSISGLLTWMPRSLYLSDNYSSAGIVLPGGPMGLTHYVVWSPLTAWLLWALLITSLLFVLTGRFSKPALVVFVVCTIALLGVERLNMKAYDRLLWWQAGALLFAPSQSQGSPMPRYLLMLIYCGIYGSTGWMKILIEPQWWTGKVLAYDLVDINFGCTSLGAWLSDKAPLVTAMSWWTLLFEAAFPFLIWFRFTNKWILVSGFLMHIGIMLTMSVNTFSLIALSAYPVLLHPKDFFSLKFYLKKN